MNKHNISRDEIAEAMKNSFRKLERIRSAASWRNSKPLLFSVPIFKIPIVGFLFLLIIEK